MNEQTSELVTIIEFARLTGLDRTTVWRKVKAGDIPGYSFKGVTLVPLNRVNRHKKPSSR